MKRKLFLLFALVALCGSGNSRLGESVIDATERFEELADSSRRMAVDEIRALLDKSFSESIAFHGRSLASLSDDEVRAFSRAAEIAAFYTKRAAYVELQTDAFKVLRERNRLAGADIRALHRSYILTRNFRDATALAESYPTTALESIPELAKIDSYDSYNAFTIDTNGLLNTIQIPIHTGDVLVALVHPNCEFSRRAMTEISLLVNVLPVDEVIWLVPFDASLSAGAIRLWQEGNDHIVFNIPRNFEEWAFLQHHEVPTFYRLQDGEIKGHVVGWPEGGNLGEIWNLFEANRVEAGESAPKHP